MYKVTIQNINQIYFSLQDHQGRRIALSKLELRVFNGLTLEEANSYKKYIPLGLCVLIQEDENFVEANFEVIEETQEEVIEEVQDEIVEETQEEVVEEMQDNIPTKEELEAMLKPELRDLARKAGIKWTGKPKAQLLEELVEYYGLQ